MKFYEKAKTFPGALKRRFLMAGTAMMTLVASVVPAFASSSGSLNYFTVTNADLKPLMDSIVENIKVLFPITLTLTGIFCIINLVPRIIRRSVSG